VTEDGLADMGSQFIECVGLGKNGRTEGLVGVPAFGRFLDEEYPFRRGVTSIDMG
jgi:hypothetical protein